MHDGFSPDGFWGGFDVDRLLAEDVPVGDLTTRALGIGGQPGRITFTARQDLVAAGVEEAVALLTRVGAVVVSHVPSGTVAPAGTLLLTATGTAAALHAGWKLAQTLMEWASGIAAATQGIVMAARAVNPAIQVATTRKTPPFTRALAVRAVLAGGGSVHRLGLSDTLLLFPEHRAFLGGTADDPGALAAAIARLRAHAPERAIVAEVTDEAEALAALAAHVDVLQLEKFPPPAVARVVERRHRRPDGRPVIAAAGGINAANAAAYARAGADVLVTSAPYTAAPAEIQVRLLSA